MMKYIVTSLLILCSIVGLAQPTTTNPYLGVPKSLSYVRGWLQVDSGFVLVQRDTLVSPIRIGEQRFRLADSSLYIAISTNSVNGNWIKQRGVGDVGNTIYTGDGSLTEDRTVDLSGNILNVKDGSNIQMAINPQAYTSTYTAYDGTADVGLVAQGWYSTNNIHASFFASDNIGQFEIFGKIDTIDHSSFFNHFANRFRFWPSGDNETQPDYFFQINDGSSNRFIINTDDNSNTYSADTHTFPNPTRVTIGDDMPDSIVQTLVVNSLGKRNLLVGGYHNPVVSGSNDTDSSSFNIINAFDSIGVTNTNTTAFVGRFPRSTLRVGRETTVTANSIRVEEMGALDVQKIWIVGGVDTFQTAPSGSDFVWANRNRTTISNEEPSHRVVIQSGTTDWDATPVSLSTLEIEPSTSNSIRLRRMWAANVGYLFDGATTGLAAHDTVDNYIGFYSTNFLSTNTKVLKYFDFASSSNGISKVDSQFFLFQRAVTGTNNSFSYIDGKLSLGGGRFSTVYRLDVNDSAIIRGALTLSALATSGSAPSTIGTTKMVITDDNGRLSFADIPGGSSGITIGSTTITSGTSGRVLYDNAGVVGEMTTSGSGTQLALTNSPTLTTPVISSITNTGTLTLPTVTGTIMANSEANITSNSTWSPQGDSRVNYYDITAQAAAATTISNPSGTPANHNILYIRVKDNGTARALTWSGTQWRASSDLPLPSTTTISKTMYLKFIYNSADTKWDFIGYLNNF